MNIHNIILHGYKASAEPPGALYLGTIGSRGSEQLRVTPGAGWEDLAVQVIFNPCRVSVLLPEDGILDVPWEATAKPLVIGAGRIVFRGVRDGVIKISTDVQYRLEGHSPVDGSASSQEPTPGVVEQVLAKMEADKQQNADYAQQAQSAAECSTANAAAAQCDAEAANQSAASAQSAAVESSSAAESASQDAQTAGEMARNAEDSASAAAGSAAAAKADADAAKASAESAAASAQACEESSRIAQEQAEAASQHAESAREAVSDGIASATTLAALGITVKDGKLCVIYTES